jgi:hypothetical protein
VARGCRGACDSTRAEHTHNLASSVASSWV